MRILHVNKFLYRRGGAEAYMLDLAELQRAQGHEVEHLAMRHPDNEPSRFEPWFPDQVDFEPAPDSLGGKIRGAGRLLWSSSAAAGMRHVVETFRPDLVHLHNIYHQLSPSVLRPLADAGIPAVMTLHDYKLACPTYRFLDHGRICEACLPRRFWSPALRRCNGGSLAASALNGVELAIHTATGAYGHIRRFLCPSRFLEAKMRAGRVYPERLRWIPNFTDVEGVTPKDVPGGDVVYAGRLSDEKGVDVLIDAAAHDGRIRLEVLGDGPSRGALEDHAARVGVAGRVRFAGRLSHAELRERLRAAAVVAVPSRWYENMPLTVLEAFAAGVPVIASDLGGLPELVDHGVDGFVVPAEDPAALAEALGDVLDDPRRTFSMGVAARRKAEATFDPQRHLERLGRIYDEALDAVPQR